MSDTSVQNRRRGATWAASLRISQTGNAESEARTGRRRVVFLVRVTSATIEISRTFDSCVSYVATVADVAGGLENNF